MNIAIGVAPLLPEGFNLPFELYTPYLTSAIGVFQLLPIIHILYKK